MTNGGTTFNCADRVTVKPQLSANVTVKSYVPSGPALITTNPPLALPPNVPVKPGVMEETEITVTKPLSVGKGCGAKFLLSPLKTSSPAKLPTTGGVFAVTLMLSIVNVDKPLPSTTCKETI